ncbi:DUF2637 domain-containing protein [Streptomyces sp. NBC_01808]|uniref:DUF2637 domain-containing protein n=1 Tax=Streptomyces sp. NBC_01808 TaxID=2975947 RepID=UPI002DDB6F36|nr:DUF2637 domain-containing protein [Streptomyces sp. NBC_01808]WSA39294.1 DUF2637 domain-containing protein [Streptomyces sp. NBC_01808]
MPQPSDASTPIPGAVAIRFGIALLGTAGFTLSYDALRHMAVASHVREPLAYVFPFVIDGFIAIGIGTLLLLRTAPLRSRLYVWALVGIATAVSIAANALHAIRLNEQPRPDTGGLRLDDFTVGALSAIAPLALAGAVHLYLLVRRHTNATHSATRDRHTTASPATPPTKMPKNPPKPAPAETATITGEQVAEAPAESRSRPRGRQPSAALGELVAIGRNAPLGRDDRVSRRSVEKAIRAAGHTIGKDRLVQVTHQLQAERDQAREPAQPQISSPA